MLNTIDVGSGTRAKGFKIAKCYPAVVRSVLRHLANCHFWVYFWLVWGLLQHIHIYFS